MKKKTLPMCTQEKKYFYQLKRLEWVQGSWNLIDSIIVGTELCDVEFSRRIYLLRKCEEYTTVSSRSGMEMIDNCIIEFSFSSIVKVEISLLALKALLQ